MAKGQKKSNREVRKPKQEKPKTETVQGGNRIVELTYRLSAENFRGSPSKVRLTDRLPRAADVQIKITLLSASVNPAEALPRAGDDPREGLRLSSKDGVMHWDIDVPGKALGPTAATVEYKFRLEYDKQMGVVGM